MNAHATALVETQSSLAAVLALLDGHEEKSLVIEYAGRVIQPGYHVTEVKAGSFVTLDCGGNPDAWQETVLQVEDIPSEEGRTFMTAGKFRAIMAQVDRKVRLNHDARLTFEVGQPGEAMRIFDVAGIAMGAEEIKLSLGERAAICKPRHRAAQAVAEACCGPSSSASKCC